MKRNNTKEIKCRDRPPSASIQVREMMLNGNVGGTLGRKDNCNFELFKKGTKIWIKDVETVWTSAELIQDFNFNSPSTLVKRLSDGEEIDYDIVKNGLPFICNPQILLGKDDLTHLSYLHEPAVLNNLKYRFQSLHKIYTYSGVALVAINPYDDCSNLYGEDVIQIYGGQGSNVRSLIPHVFSVAEEAVHDMREYGKNQSVIVSGESGAGKTVNSKFVMKYLTHVTSSGSDHGIEKRVLASNPVMEAFGNAKTIRNDNSSRFGKFIQINFNGRNAISGAEMMTYLLEKSRVVVSAKGERSYHILYQLTSSASHPLVSDLCLENSSRYFYTNQGALTIDDIDDRDEFNKTLTALRQLQISDKECSDIFRLLAGILFLGNIEFVESGEYCQIKANSKNWLDKFCSNYGIDSAQISDWLCAREIRAGSEVLRKQLTIDEAVGNRDAIAKLIYASIFNHIVNKINENLATATTKQDKNTFIGVLDIYGFESYEKNSFEQFCINYANEKLQNTFNRHVFKLEQAEYEKEQISFETIQFYDNEQCIDLISNLISFLDEQCKRPNGSDTDWLIQMESAPLKDFEHLQLPKIRSSNFIVKHYAMNVSYDVTGFVAKNTDSVNEKLLSSVVDTKSFDFLHTVLDPVKASLSSGNTRKQTVGVQFRKSLNDLTTLMSSSRPHYIRCIKPNDDKKSFCFDAKKSIDQLRACGVLETIRISATGYPSRWSYEDFSKRYRVLFPKKQSLAPKEFTMTICSKFLGPESFAFGKTKIFMKTGQISKLESLRQEMFYNSALKIQTAYRGFIARRRYKELVRAHHAAILLQARIRGYIQYKKYQRIRSAILEIQIRYRASIVRKRILKMRYEQSAIIVQRCIRNYFIRRERIIYLHKITVVQACVRRWLAKRLFKQLKIEAKSVNHLQNVNKDLANRMLTLHEDLDKTNHEKDILNNSLILVEIELNNKRNTVENLTEELKCAREELEHVRSRLTEMTENYEHLNDSTSSVIERLTKENEDISNLLKEKSEKLESMSEQLIKNADLLVSPDFRGDVSSTPNRSVSNLSSGEIQLLLDQQRTINDLRQKLSRVLANNERLKIDTNTLQLSDSSVFKTYDLMKIQSLELLTSRYKEEIDSFANAASKGDGFELKLLDYLKRIQEENERIQEENIGLRVLLSETFEQKTTSVRDSGHWSTNSSDDGSSHSNGDIDNYLSNNQLLRQLRLNLHVSNQVIKNRDRQIEQLEDLLQKTMFVDLEFDENGTTDIQVQNVNVNNGYSRANSGFYQLSFQADETNDDEMLSEDSRTVTNLIENNLILQNKLDCANDELATTRAYLTGSSSMSVDHDEQSNETLKLESLSSSNGYTHSGLLEVFNVPEFARLLIYDLKPRLAIKLSPQCLPAYLQLSAFRYFDHAQNDALISNLFNATHLILKDLSTNFKDDFDVQSLWLCNSWRLLNLLRQYGGEAESEWTAQNTPTQNSQRMLNFNFEPIRNQLELRVKDFYQNFMKCDVEPLLSPKIYPAILHHESGLTVIQTRSKQGKLSRESSKETVQSLEDLKEFLNIVYSKLEVHGAGNALLNQVFAQIGKWICALALNQLIYRKDICTFEKAIQIKHNVSEIQSWFKQRKLSSTSLEPLIQASHLIQSQKKESNIDVLAGELTSMLTSKQIISILTTYKPPEGFEEDIVDANFIVKLSKKLEERDANNAENESPLMPGTTYLKPFDTQPFVYSAEDIQKLTLPSCLKLDSVSRLV